VSTFAIGDLQGCFATLEQLLNRISFNPQRDRLWFVGDLVNRGSGSLECLRFVRSLGDRAVSVLGNHDLHLLAINHGITTPGKLDTLDSILSAPDRHDLLDWLRWRPLFHVDGKYALVHAGLLPEWSWKQARLLSDEISTALSGDHPEVLLGGMYGNTPDRWSESLVGIDRARVVINAMTRMRILDQHGRMNLQFKGEERDIPPGHMPWFDAPTERRDDKILIAGHWSALGIKIKPNFIGLDSGCIWGGDLSAFCLETREVIQVPCAEIKRPLGWD
jgi:bis(5'-nucleosyl)-tetraphosphatase (symmetrical)